MSWILWTARPVEGQLPGVPYSADSNFGDRKRRLASRRLMTWVSVNNGMLRQGEPNGVRELAGGRAPRQFNAG